MTEEADWGHDPFCGGVRGDGRGGKGMEEED